MYGVSTPAGRAHEGAKVGDDGDDRWRCWYRYWWYFSLNRL